MQDHDERYKKTEQIALLAKNAYLNIPRRKRPGMFCRRQNPQG
jgi:hypothetical protein